MGSGNVKGIIQKSLVLIATVSPLVFASVQ